MRLTALAASGLVSVLALPASAATGAGSAGPFVGTVAQGETDSYIYNNNPSGQDCIALAADYSITLTYVPNGDVLTLSAGSTSASGPGSSIRVTSGVCAYIPFTVTGTSVASSAHYVVHVTRQVLPPLS